MTDKLSPKLVKASDASVWIYCARRAWLDKYQPGEYTIEPFNQLLIDAGLEHETTILTKLENQYPVTRAESFEHTLALMQQGIPVIYQGRLLNESENIVGYPDFLIRHESGEYQPADAKLSLNENKKAIQIQLGIYRRLLGNRLPAIVFLGDGRAALLGNEVDAIVDEFIADMQRLLELQQQPAVRYSHSKCRVCPYHAHCLAEFKANEDPSLLYGIHGRAADHLADIGITTITQLALCKIESLPDVPYLKGYQRKHRAILQAQSSLTNKVFQLSEAILPEGIWIHFDIEDNPLTQNRERHVYLWGLLPPGYTKESFDYSWSDDESGDYQGWLVFLQKIEAYRQQFTSVILAHYSNHEKATIQKYAQRYAMENHATVIWLLGENSPLFDLQKLVQECLVLPLQGYGLKDICKHPSLVNFQWKNEESGSQWSVVQFQRFLSESDQIRKQHLKSAILEYNCDDVMATRQLELWLRKLFRQD